MTIPPGIGCPEKVIVVEVPDEARAVADHLTQIGIDSSQALVVALEPSVRAALKELGVEAADTLPFFGNAAHESVLRASAEIDRLIESGVRFTTGDGLEQVYAKGSAAFIGTRLVLMLRAIEVLEGIRRVYPESTYCFCARKARYRHAASLFIQPDEGFLDSLGPKFCQQHGLSESNISSPDVARSAVQEKGQRVAWWQASLDRIIARVCLMACRMQSSLRCVLVTSLWSNQAVDPLRLSIRAQLPRVKSVALTRGRRRRKQELWDALVWAGQAALGWEPADRVNAISQDVITEVLARRGEARLGEELESTIRGFLRQHGEVFRYRDVPLLEEVESEIRHGLVPYLIGLSRVASAQTSVLRHLRPSLVLSWASGESYHTLGKISAEAGVPAMVIPLKTLVSRQDELEDLGQRQIGQEMITNDYPYAAVQTPLALNYMKHTRYTGQLVLTGPLNRAKVAAEERHLSRARFFQEMGAPGRIVVYAPSMKRIHSYYVVQTLDEVLSNMVDLVEMVSAMEGVYLILRLHPDGVVTRDAIETLIDLPRCVRISDTGRPFFAGVLALADVLISNTSTTSEEALLNGVPVILYDKWARYNHLDAPEVRCGVPGSLSPAYYVADKAYLSSTTAWVLSNHPPGTVLPREVLGQYVFQQELSNNFYDFVGQVVRQTRRARSPLCP